MDKTSAFAGLQLLIFIAWVAPVVSQDGFLSIDCGSDVNYTDSTTGISWVTDANYISTGRNVQNLTVHSKDVLLNKRQAGTLRYFDEGRSRDCYVLPVTPNRTYLIRPTWYYGSVETLASNIAFDVYFNATLWWNNLAVTEDYDYHLDDTLWWEAIVYSPGSQLNVCLVKEVGSSSSFLSSLELRELDSTMYASEVGPSNDFGSAMYLNFFLRLNCGAPLSGPSVVRYPDDRYDRIWSTPDAYDNHYGTTDMSNTNISSVASTHAPDLPPTKVMEDAWVANQTVLTFYFGDGLHTGTLSVRTYFQELDGNASASNVRGMNYYFNGEFVASFNSSDQPQEIIKVTEYTVSEESEELNISVVQASWSKLGPILNAFEVFTIDNFNTSATNTDEVDILAALQRQLNLSDWGGDPCFPVPCDWLSCTWFSTASRVTQLFLQNIAKTETVFPVEILNLTELTHLNVSNHELSTFPTNLKELNKLKILDFSHNNLSGSIGSFLDAVDLETIQEIHATDNRFEGEFPTGSLVHQAVKIVTFDRNFINGNVDLLEWQTSVLNVIQRGGNLSALQLFSLIDNNVTNVYPSDLSPVIVDLLKSRNRTILDTGILIADAIILNAIMIDENHLFLASRLGGNPWCKQAKSKSLTQQYLCRFSTKDALVDPGTSLCICFSFQVLGFQLHGLASIGPIIFSCQCSIIAYYSQAPSSLNQKMLAITIGTSVGAFVVFVSTICWAALWKLRKQTHALREIQEALAKQKVQPPFYSYADLRVATKDFGSDNKLGQGAFGAVYKAVLPDEMILAVKKLFSSKQALTEFLNEVVLITGIKHRNLVQLKGCCIKEQQRLLVYEYAENGNLAEALWDASSKKEHRIRKQTKLDWKQRFNICVGVARGLVYLHEELQPRIIHRDIKPANILLDKNLNPKIADFGLARPFLDEQSRADYTKLAGTPGYLAPEYVSQGQLTEKADVFSFGILILEIVSGRPCIHSELPSEKVYLLAWTRNLRNEGGLLDLVDPIVRDSSNEVEAIRVINIALLCLHFDPARRPTMSHVVTMLLGSMDVTVFLDIPLYNQPDFSSLPVASGNAPRDSELSPTLETLGEEYPLMDQDFIDLNISRSHLGGSLEMSDLSGR